MLKVQLNNYIVYHAKMPVDLFVNYRSIGIFYAKQKVITNIFYGNNNIFILHFCNINNDNCCIL